MFRRSYNSLLACVVNAKSYHSCFRLCKCRVTSWSVSPHLQNKLNSRFGASCFESWPPSVANLPETTHDGAFVSWLFIWWLSIMHLYKTLPCEIWKPVRMRLLQWVPQFGNPLYFQCVMDENLIGVVKRVVLHTHVSTMSQCAMSHYSLAMALHWVGENALADWSKKETKKTAQVTQLFLPGAKLLCSLEFGLFFWISILYIHPLFISVKQKEGKQQEYKYVSLFFKIFFGPRFVDASKCSQCTARWTLMLPTVLKM